jgi:hypothetical protein
MARNWDELERAWQYADQLWFDDSMRRQFVQEWQEMRDALKRYRQEQSERYLQFLLQRKQALDEYFGH